MCSELRELLGLDRKRQRPKFKDVAWCWKSPRYRMCSGAGCWIQALHRMVWTLLSLKGTYRQNAYIRAGLPALFIRSPLTQSSAGQGSDRNQWEHTRLSLFKGDHSHRRTNSRPAFLLDVFTLIQSSLVHLALYCYSYQQRNQLNGKGENIVLWNFVSSDKSRKLKRVSSGNSKALFPSHLFANLKQIHSHSQLNPFNSEV